MFLRKAAVVAIFFLLTPILLIASVIFYGLRSYNLQSHSSFISDSKIGNSDVAYAALPSTEEQFAGGVIAGDERAEKLKNFFGEYNSVLANYANLIVDDADKFGLDFALLPAISMQESIGCKKQPAGTFNCFGWGIYTHKHTSFSSYEDAINTVSEQLAKNYIEIGLNTPEEIGPKYNPGNVNDWVDKINFFMDKLHNQSTIAYLTNP